MSARATAFAFALLAIVLTVAQDVLPARDWYHSWEYITIVAIAIVVMVGHAWRAWRGKAEPKGKRIALALAGAIAVAIAGLLSGLIGPDTVTFVGTPGTVAPIPSLGVAAFFAPADPQTIPRGDATVELRRRNAAPLAIGTRPVPVGLSVAFTQLRPAAYVSVRNGRGQRMTVTQPNNSSFLSPVILFRQAQKIHDRTFPFDQFAVPAAGRMVRILYFSPADLAALRHDPAAPVPAGPGAILSVTDDAGAEHGITMAQSGREAVVDGLHVTITLGAYPVLQVASAPQPFVMLGGLLLFLGASAWILIGSRSAVAAADGTAPQPREPVEGATASS
ncbi:MAG TPA: hypothetical protein VIJ64_02240 [Candidatus Lustribacter sp.]